MLRNNYRKPLYYKKSKAEKQIEQEYYSESEDETFTETQSEYMRPAQSRGERYDYSEFEDENSYVNQSKYSMNDMYTTENSIYNIEHDVDEYTSQMSMFNEPRQRKKRVRYGQSKMEFSDDPNSECKVCSKGGNRNIHESNTNIETDNYTSDYDYQTPKKKKSSRNKHNSQRKRSEIDTESELSPHRQDVHHVYLAEQPVGNRAFNYKEKHKKEQTTDFETSSVEESEVYKREKIASPQNKTHYEVYVADVPQDQTRIFNQGARERILSVTNYDGGVPIMALRDKKGALEKTDSGIVYLPVMVLDQAIKLPKNKLVPPESLLKNTEETQKPLLTNVEVYAAMGDEQGNLFKKTQYQSGMGTKNRLFPQVIPTYAISRTTTGNPMKSIASGVQAQNKTDQNGTDYPVQKSYINVVPQRPSSSNSNKSKSKLKSVLSGFSRKSQSGITNDMRKSKKERKSKKKDKKKKTDGESESSQSVPLDDIGSPNIETLTIPGPKEDHNQSIFSTSNKKKSAIKSKNIENMENMEDSIMGNTLPPIIGQGIEETRNKLPRISETKKHVLGDQGNTEEIKKSVGGKLSVINENKKSILGEHKESKAHERKSYVTQTGVGANQIEINDNKKSILGKHKESQAHELKSDVIQTGLGDRQSLINEKRKSSIRQSTSKGHEMKNSMVEGKAMPGNQSGVDVTPSNFAPKPSSFAGKLSSVRGKQSISGVNTSDLAERKNTHEDFWKSEPNIQPIRDVSRLSPVVSESISKNESKVMHTEKKSHGSKIFGRKKKDHTIDEDVKIIPKSIKKNHDENINDIVQLEQQNEKNYYASTSKPSITDQTRSKSVRRRLPKLLKKPTVQQLSNQKDQQALKFLDYNVVIIEYMFLSVKSFLGLSLHDLLMEISHNFTH